MPLMKSLRRIVQQVTGATSSAASSQSAVQTVETKTAQLQQTLDQQTKAAGTMADQLAALQQSMTKLPKPLLVEELTGTLGSAGTVVLATSKGFTAPPAIVPITTWSGAQMVAPYVAGKTAAAITVGAKRSKGTLLLTSGPFEDAPAGTTVTILAIGT